MTTKTLPPLEAMTAKEIRAEIVEGGCAGNVPPYRFMRGIDRICQLTGVHPEELFKGICDEVRERSGKEMPLF